ncbi:MAG: terminase large subunit [Clostridia bacterium]|nr:terminase large subunit [Clostridia bacterium]
MICCNEINEYIKFVEENPNETDDEIKLLIKNIIKPTLSRDDVFFDEEMFQKAVKYCEKWYYKLFPYQKFAYALFFMYDKNNTDIVIFPDILIVMARGNGKDGMIMPLANFLQTHYYGVKNYHIDIVATSEEQALNSFNVVYNMLESNKKTMKKYFYWNKTEVINKITHSILRYNTANAKTKDGKQTGMIIFNELHAYEDYKQINVYSSGLGKIKHARTVTITTNGTVRDGPLDEKLSMSKLVLNGEDNFLGLLPIIYKINDFDTVHIPMKKFLETGNKEDIDITVWCQANPSLRYMPILMNELIRDYIKMQKQKSYRVEFYAKRMNLPQQDEEDVVTDWNNILRASYKDIEKEIPRELGDVAGRNAIIGIDYADLNDFASAGFLFKVDGEFIWRHRTWVCANGKYYGDIKFPFDNIGQEGYEDFVIVKTETIDAREIILWLITEMSKYNIKKWVMDMYRFLLLKKIFEEFGISIETKDNPYGQVRMIRKFDSITAIVAPRIEVAFAEGKINIGNSALMRWAINNTATKMGKDGNKKYVKIEPKLRKNDPFMAFVAAMSAQELLDEEIIYV